MNRMIAFFIVAICANCGYIIRDKLNIGNSDECIEMERECTKARDYRKESKEIGVKDVVREVEQEYLDKRCREATDECHRK